MNKNGRKIHGIEQLERGIIRSREHIFYVMSKLL
jgi:hypothetical protein